LGDDGLPVVAIEAGLIERIIVACSNGCSPHLPEVLALVAVRTGGVARSMSNSCLSAVPSSQFSIERTLSNAAERILLADIYRVGEITVASHDLLGYKHVQLGLAGDLVPELLEVSLSMTELCVSQILPLPLVCSL